MALFRRRAPASPTGDEGDVPVARRVRPPKKKRSPKSVVGIDFQDNSIRVVQLTKRRKESIMERAGFIPVDGAAWRMGRIVDPDAFSQQFGEGLVATGITGRRVVVGLSGTNSVVRVVRLPKMKPALLKETLNVQLGQYVPFPPEDTLFRYVVLGEVMEDEIEKQEILILATRYSIIEPILLAIQKEKMDPVGLHIGFLSEAEILKRYYEDYSQSIALIDFRNAITDIVFLTGQQPDVMEEEEETTRRRKKKKKAKPPATAARLSRTVEFGYEKVMTSLAAELEVGLPALADIFRATEIDLMDVDSAEEISGEAPDDPFASFSEDGESEVGEDEDDGMPSQSRVNGALRKVFGQFAQEIEKSKRFFESFSRRRERLGRIVLVGNLGRFPNLETFLTESTGLDVVIGDPLEAVDYGSTEWEPEEMRGRVSELTAPVSLALQALSMKSMAPLNLLPREYAVKKTSVAVMKWVAILSLAPAYFGYTVLEDYDNKIAGANTRLRNVENEQSRSRDWTRDRGDESVVFQNVCEEMDGGVWEGEVKIPPVLGSCQRSYSYEADANAFDGETSRLNGLRPKVCAVVLLSATQFPWEVLLDEIRTLMPKTIWLSQRAGDSNNMMGIAVEGMDTVALAGQALSMEDIYRFLFALRESTYFEQGFEWSIDLAVGDEAALRDIERQRSASGSALDDLVRLFRATPQVTTLFNFNLTLTLNPELNDRAKMQEAFGPLSLCGGGGGGGSSSADPGPGGGGMPSGGGMGGGAGFGRPPGFSE
ncbi:pilus assembly protein PilM [bacterium]|nr:pilus assembly protein PilM [bacterium]